MMRYRKRAALPRRAHRLIATRKIRLVIVACCVFALTFVSTALAVNYAQGSGGAGGTYSTPGFAPRSYNRVYHAAGYTWTVYYRHTDNSTAGVVTNTNNPTEWPYADGYARANCHNVNDTGPVQWTCQTS